MTIEIKEIEITRSEGPCELCGITMKFNSWKEADKWLVSQQHTFPDLGYDKHDFKVIWEDGETYVGRLDCQQICCNNPDLSTIKHIREEADFCTSKERPSWIDKETYNTYINLKYNYL